MASSRCLRPNSRCSNNKRERTMHTGNATHRKWRPPSWMEEGQVQGGFALVPTNTLMSCWYGYKTGSLRLSDVRAWIAVVEMIERRTASTSERIPRYDYEELIRLTGSRGCRGAVRRLCESGLVSWSRNRVRVAGVAGRSDIRRKWIPVPRRMLRWLAKYGTAADIATVFGHVSRCLFYDSKSKTCRSGGHCTAQWVAEHFGVGERSVKRARSGWLARGWLRAVDDGRAGFRRGARFIIEFTWSDPHGMAPQIDRSRAHLAPPRGQQDPPSEIKEPDRDSGFERPVCLSHIVPEDLNDASRLAEIHRQAGERGLVAKSQAGALLVFSAAARAKRCGERNPCGMLATIIRKKLWNHISSIDEDAARSLFKRRPELSTRGQVPRRRYASPPMPREQIRMLVRSALC